MLKCPALLQLILTKRWKRLWRHYLCCWLDLDRSQILVGFWWFYYNWGVILLKFKCQKRVLKVIKQRHYFRLDFDKWNLTFSGLKFWDFLLTMSKKCNIKYLRSCQKYEFILYWLFDWYSLKLKQNCWLKITPGHIELQEVNENVIILM